MSGEYHGKQAAAIVGPWGGEGGYHWDDGVHTRVRQVEIAHGAGIDSIKIEYELVNGRSVWSQNHGGIGGTKIDKIKLEHPNEYLTSVHGYYGSFQEWGPVIVRSLTFQTNTTTYGPYGVEDGTYFTFPKSHGKVIGFLGRSGRYLDSIGAYIEPPTSQYSHQYGTPQETTSHAPISSNPITHPHQYGTPNTWETSHAPISSNHISHPHQNRTQKTWETTPHAPIFSDHISHPHQNGTPKTWETTSHAPISSNPISHPLQYGTLKTWETASYGAQKYEYSMIQGNIGANYDLIVALKRKDGHDTTPINQYSPMIPHDITRSPKIDEIDDKPRSIEKKIEKVGSKSGQLGVVTSGPWGGNGGSLFDDGVYDGIRQVIISRNVCIVSIRACYDQNGQPVLGTKNGGTGSFKYDKIVFDYPSEMLTHLTGYYGPAMMMGPNVIKSVTFHTTHGKHGPYGEEQGEFFTTKLKEGSVIVGLHGRKGLFLDAIGVHVLEGKLKPPFNISHGLSKPNNQLALLPKKDDNHFNVGKRGKGDEVISIRRNSCVRQGRSYTWSIAPSLSRRLTYFICIVL